MKTCSANRKISSSFFPRFSLCSFCLVDHLLFSMVPTVGFLFKIQMCSFRAERIRLFIWINIHLDSYFERYLLVGAGEHPSKATTLSIQIRFHANKRAKFYSYAMMCAHKTLTKSSISQIERLGSKHLTIIIHRYTHIYHC